MKHLLLLLLILTVSGPAVAEVISQGGRQFFVANNGSDSNNGRFAAQGVGCTLPSGCPGAGIDGPWRTLSKVNSATFATGDDLYLRAGDTWDEQLVMAPAGGVNATTNRQIIGSYYCAVTPGTAVACGTAGSSAYVNAPTNWTAWRRPRDYTYTAARPIIRGTYLQSCRQSDLYGVQTGPAGQLVTGTGPPGLKCAWNTAAYVAGSKGNYGPGGQPARPTGKFSALIMLNFGDDKKWVTLQDLEIEGSAGESIGIAKTGNPACYGEAYCSVESVAQRIKIHHGANVAVALRRVSRFVGRFLDIRDASLSVGDRQFGLDTRGGQLEVNGCGECQVLWEGNDIRQQFGEAAASYKTSRILYRGHVIGMHSLSGGGAINDTVYEQNILFGMDPVYSPPSVDHPRFPFWSMINENPSEVAGTPGPVWNDPGNTEDLVALRLVRRNNIVASGGNIAWMQSAERPPTSTAGQAQNGPFAYTHATTHDVGNTVIVGSQSQGAVQWLYRDLQAGCVESGEPQGVVACRARPASFLNKLTVKNNLFLIQSGYTAASGWCKTEKGSLGTFDFSNNGFGAAPGSCGGTDDETGTTAQFGLPSVDWIAAEWQGLPGDVVLDADDFTPTAGGSGNGQGIAMLTADDVGVINTGTEWDWVLSQRMWLPECNTTGAQVAKGDWVKPLFSDFCGNPRGEAPDLGALESGRGDSIDFGLSVD